MSKAANIYWDNGTQKRLSSVRRPATGTRAKAEVKPRRAIPWWLSVIVFVSLFGMLCISINLRAFTEVKEESDQNVRLASQIQNLTDENLALQEEIHSLKSDPAVIQREARRLGLDLKTIAAAPSN